MGGVCIWQVGSKQQHTETARKDDAPTDNHAAKIARGPLSSAMHKATWLQCGPLLFANTLCHIFRQPENNVPPPPLAGTLLTSKHPCLAFLQLCALHVTLS